jgi:hypothetical protein
MVQHFSTSPRPSLQPPPTQKSKMHTALLPLHFLPRPSRPPAASLGQIVAPLSATFVAASPQSAACGHPPPSAQPMIASHTHGRDPPPTHFGCSSVACAALLPYSTVHDLPLPSIQPGCASRPALQLTIAVEPMPAKMVLTPPGSAAPALLLMASTAFMVKSRHNMVVLQSKTV